MKILGPKKEYGLITLKMKVVGPHGRFTQKLRIHDVHHHVAHVFLACAWRKLAFHHGQN